MGRRPAIGAIRASWLTMALVPRDRGALRGWPVAKLAADAHLAALAMEHGLTLCSTDGDFARFRQLKWLNPLAL